MKQNDNRIFRKEDLDWKELETIGIHKEELEKSGDMELLLQGEETETVPLKIRTSALRLTMDATPTSTPSPVLPSAPEIPNRMH